MRPARTLLLVVLLLLPACGPGDAEGVSSATVASGTDVPSVGATPTPDTAGTDTPDADAGATPDTDTGPDDDGDSAEFAGRPAGSRVVVREVGRRPHDTSAFTQGLEFHEGRLFESRGLYAADEDVVLTEIDPADGRPLRALERDPDDIDYFAEGLTIHGDRLIQLTWRERTAFVYDRDTFERIGTYEYDTEGWGICTEPDRFVMSDGTSTLTFRDLDTFEALGTVTVTLDGQPVQQLNELECVDGLVWANVWLSPTIVVIDPADGQVVTVVDASTIAGPGGRSLEDPGADVLNGIAYDELTDTWLLTGKLWPWMYEVEFDCVEGCATPTHYRRARPAPVTTALADHGTG